MKKALKNIIAIIMGGFLALSPVALGVPVFAENSCGGVNTAIINCSEGSGNGEAIGALLKNGVNFLSVGIGVLGVIGITVVGIQYLTAGGKEEQTRKAKRRLLEIVIGLVAYFLMYGVLNWLGVLNK